MILFIHIPKTAGTSFRAALINEFGPNVLFDYGEESKVTSPIMRDMYKNYDGDKLLDYISKNDVQILGGHCALRHFHILKDIKIATFFRNYVVRCLSEYLHFKRSKVANLSLRDFVLDNGNTQWKYVEKFDIASFEFIGLTERYSESIDLFNKVFGTSLKKCVINKNPDANYNLPEDILEFVSQYNSLDAQLYAKAKSLFEARFTHFENL